MVLNFADEVYFHLIISRSRVGVAPLVQEYLYVTGLGSEK